MPDQDTPPKHIEILARPDVALNGANAQRRAIQGTHAAEVTSGSGCGSCQEAGGRRSTARGERDADARAPAKLKRRPSGLVLSRISAHKPRPEITLEVGLCDIRIRRSSHLTALERTGGGIRSSVTAFSNASKRRLFFIARNFPNLDIMLTLTYPAAFPMDGRQVKNHWRRFRQWMVRNAANTGLWVLEFQERGAPHFHVFLQKPLDRDEVAKAWYKIVNTGDPKHLRAGTRIERFRFPPALGGYVMKYAAKLEQKEVPAEFENVGRFWGTWGKPEITKNVVLPISIGKHLVRTIRKAHIKERRAWSSHKHFRDNGRSGFIAWETSTIVRRMLDEFFEDGVLYTNGN